MTINRRTPQPAFAPHSGGGGGLTGQSGSAAAGRFDRDGGRRGIGDRSGDPQASGAQGRWLSNQQYREYLDLLKQRAQAQQVVSVPLNPASYPAVTMNAGGDGLSPYSVTQPGYGFLAPPGGAMPGGAKKGGGYVGAPRPRPTGLPRHMP